MASKFFHFGKYTQKRIKVAVVIEGGDRVEQELNLPTAIRDFKRDVRAQLEVAGLTVCSIRTLVGEERSDGK